MDHGGHERSPNRVQLRELASLLEPESWIETISVFPSNRPESLILELVEHHYPEEQVAEAYTEIQSYTNGDFHITYIEDHHGERWMCRWNRHESDEYTRDHYHAPPRARHEDGENRDYPREFSAVVAEVAVPWVYDRMGEVWDSVDT